ncbi:MAG: ribbon-helix-helix protein, CopG family [Roseitalea porphyridii]|jgi:hypothetical protein|uniref:ribbon-helix-helix protein, CopG family n=1 Tax=Roseitalea porphyridii TaxID=1852022 RepID=UPI0032EA93D0
MATLTIRLPASQHERLKNLAARRGVSLNKMFEEFAARAIVESDAETRFLLRADRADVGEGLEVLDRLDGHYGSSEP